MMTFKSRIAAIDAKIESSNTQIEKFKTTFATSQSGALVWADSLYVAVATKELFERVKRVILSELNARIMAGMDEEKAGKEAIAEARRMAGRMLVQTASYVASQSTGTCSTFYGRCETEVWAQLNEEYNGPLAVM